MNSAKKVIRHERLFKMLQRNPFLTDEQLAKNLAVSIQTIRLDRLSLNIPELRERTRQMAENAQVKLKAIDKKDIVGDLIELELNHSGISMLKITPDMVLEKTGVARGYYMLPWQIPWRWQLLMPKRLLPVWAMLSTKCPYTQGLRWWQRQRLYAGSLINI